MHLKRTYLLQGLDKEHLVAAWKELKVTTIARQQDLIGPTFVYVLTHCGLAT